MFLYISLLSIASFAVAYIIHLWTLSDRLEEIVELQQDTEGKKTNGKLLSPRKIEEIIDAKDEYLFYLVAPAIDWKSDHYYNVRLIMNFGSAKMILAMIKYFPVGWNQDYIFRHCCDRGLISVAKKLINEHSVDPSALNNYAIRSAIRHRNIMMVRWLKTLPTVQCPPSTLNWLQRQIERHSSMNIYVDLFNLVR